MPNECVNSIVCPCDEENCSAVTYDIETANEEVNPPAEVIVWPISQCTACVGDAEELEILISNVVEGSTWTLEGTLPDGLTIDFENTYIIISGTPTTGGNYSFTIVLTAPDGTITQKVITLGVIEITTVAIDPYQTSVPYSFQLQASGGSGNYAWKIISGSLPAGLTLDISGLISGTPTGSTTEDVGFEVIDAGCVTADASFYTPRVAMNTTSETTTATILGYPQYQGEGIVNDVPPKKYKKLTWTGTSEQWAQTWGGLPAGRAKYEYSGTGEIDVNGNQVTDYVKNFLADCTTAADWPDIALAVGGNPGLNGIPLTFKGYCWSTDPDSCAVCDDVVGLIGDVSTNSIFDTSDLLGAGGGTFTKLSFTATGGNIATLMLSPSDVTNFPDASVNFVSGPWIVLSSLHNYSSLIEDEYTDADALSVATVVTSNSKTASSFPRTTGYVSVWTTVQYRLSLWNLLAGEDYIATVTLKYDDGTLVDVDYPFTAGGNVHVITANVPTPADGHTIQVRNPRVEFAP